jgi:hypothetical protein
VEEAEPLKKVSRKNARARANSAEKEEGRKSDTTIRNAATRFSDILPTTDYGLQREPFDPSKYTPGISMHDSANRDDAQEVSDYVTDIFQRLYNAEVWNKLLAL